ncbi:MAG: taurine ABC transporter permease [Pelagibacteraceae bacterium BACL20 MAG-120920-bin64]|jgi:taurine transport system permease protein|nr:MAG: taurine ABC transporter permease [Pelagibacteraceae bacterium BACL20 MAG-120920-bin64]
MLTGIITFVVIFAVIGSLLYGRKLAKTEKLDAVFGNPERAKGGVHWVIVGSSFLLLTWLYYSWDMAKSFYPQSANELCQVAKVNDSLLSLKYLFPIEEREFKSTSIIKGENKNIEKLANEIKNSPKLSEQDKSELLKFIDKTKKTIPLLTDERLLENETKIQIKDLTNRIVSLTEEFQKESYPPITSIEEENKRIEALKTQGKWGASATAVENTVEIPTIPETKMGLKFDAAAKELTLISEDFFNLRNHNSQYINLMQEIRDEIKAYRSGLNDTQKVASALAKDVLKIARRIEYASIFPPNTLDDMQQSIINFDEVQKKEQGVLKYVDIFLFPAGTIVSSGPNCSEQGSGRWLPKPSDTFNKFILLMQPSIGFKNVPMVWYEMMDVSKIVGFILPDWIADIMPGKYPIHNQEGTVTPNFKSNVLKVVTGEFSLFKIPVPMGHIWDSFLRVLLGLLLGIIFGVPLGLFMGLNRFAKGFFDPLIELYRPVPPLAWAPLVITVFGIDNVGKVFLLFMVSFSIMIISARAGASGTQLSKIHASHSLGASKWQILRYVIFPNSLPEILTGVRVAVGMCWGTLVAAEFLAGTTGIGFVENVAKKYFQYEVIWITIFVMGMLGLLFDIALRKIIDKTIPWHGKG